MPVPDYRVIAIEPSTARRVRESRRSPGYGHPVHAEVATGYGPCRLCLRDFEVGAERRLLFTYDPFHGIEDFPMPGPVFIHEADCGAYPEDAGFPPDLDSHRLTVAAYARGRILRAEERAEAGGAGEAVARLLARPDVDYLHVRDTEAGCYDFRIERRSDPEITRSPDGSPDHRITRSPDRHGVTPPGSPRRRA